MAYRKVVLETLPGWTNVGCFDVGPRGTPVGVASEGTFRWFVVTWALDGSILSKAGPFEAVAATGAMNSSGQVMTTVRPPGASSLRPVLLDGDTLVRDFGDRFASSSLICDFNAAGLAVGAEPIAGTANLRAFSLDVHGTKPPHYFDPPTGTVTAMATGVNEASDVVVVGWKTYGDFHSRLYAGGTDARELGPYFITDINAHRLCSGFTGGASERAGLLDVSGTAPPWTELPLPTGASSSRGSALNDKGQSIVIAEYPATAGRHFHPFLWSAGALRGLDELVSGDYLVAQGISEGGEIWTADGGINLLLTTSRPVHVSVDLGRPLWDIILAGADPSGAPIFGVAGVTVRLPNGQAVDLPAIPIPNEPLPGPEWASLNEGQRVALLAAAVAALASRMQDQHARHALTHAAQELVKRGFAQ